MTRRHRSETSEWTGGAAPVGSDPAGRGEDDEDDEEYGDDEDYEDFKRRTFDADGHLRGDPPIGRIILLVILALLVLATLALT